MWNSGIIASRHRGEYFLRLNDVNQDYVEIDKIYVKTTNFYSEVKGVVNTSETIQVSTKTGSSRGFSMIFSDGTNENCRLVIHGVSTYTFLDIPPSSIRRVFRLQYKQGDSDAVIFIDGVEHDRITVGTDPAISLQNALINARRDTFNVPMTFNSSDIEYFDMDGDFFKLNEGKGFSIKSNNGIQGTGITSNTGGVVYWNGTVWVEI